MATHALFTSRRLSKPADEIAPRLIGSVLVRVLPDGTRLAGRIVETEAYLGPDDQASHARNGRRSPRNESMYASAGTAYVYFTYGMHHCFNVVCAHEGEPQAVLVRALEPLEGLECMREFRSRGKSFKRALRDRDLCSGPGKLCEALAIDRTLDGHDLFHEGSELWLERAGRVREGLINTPRIGIGACGEWTQARLRWYLDGCEHVSKRG